MHILGMSGQRLWEPVEKAVFSPPSKLNDSHCFPDFPFTHSSGTVSYILKSMFETAGFWWVK
jgi:hypothetical protein